MSISLPAPITRSELSVRNANKRNLQERILKYLATHPCTMTQLARALEENYHKVRREVVLLNDAGLVVNDGTGRNIVYRTVATKGVALPSFHDSLSNKTFPATVIVEAALAQGFHTKAQDAASVLPQVVTHLLNLASTGNESIVNQNYVHDLRSQLLQARDLLLNHTRLIDQALANPVWWNKTALTKLAQEPELKDNLATVTQAYNFLMGIDPDQYDTTTTTDPTESVDTEG